MFFIRVELLGGEHIRDAIEHAIELTSDLEDAAVEVDGVVFESNGTDVHVRPDSDVDELVASWERAQQLKVKRS
jgi:hypothetical protein